MLLALVALATAEDLDLSIAYRGQSLDATLHDVAPGPLPSLVLDAGDHELRLDLSLTRFSATEIGLDFVATRIPDGGGKGAIAWQATLSGRGTTMATYMAGAVEQPSTEFALLATGSHPVAQVESGVLAGCQYGRTAGMTDVVCAAGAIRHHRVERHAIDEIEAGVVRARANPALTVDAGPTRVTLGGRSFDGYRVTVAMPDSAPSYNLVAWTGADGLDEVRCQGGSEAACTTLMTAFIGGLPTELQ